MRSLFIHRPVPSRKKGDRVQGSGFSICFSSFILHPSSFRLQPKGYFSSRGYTLVEILITTTLTLILLAAVVQMFSSVAQSITNSRAVLESADRLRSAAARLQMDLQGVTVTMRPPRSPEDGEGYFEYIEGAVTQTNTGPYGIPQPINTDNGQYDTSVGDYDDILMFTTRSTGRPFVIGAAPVYFVGAAPVYDAVNAQFGTQSVQTDVAEVAWFIRGRTLYRRILLVAPGPWEYLKDINGNPVYPDATGFYGKYDVSVRAVSIGGVWKAIPNTLSDLTRRECRFAHPTNPFPFDARRWGQLGLPTLRECSDPQWIAGFWDASNSQKAPWIPTIKSTVDFWSNDPNARFSDSAILKGAGLTYSGTRIADDVILTNVIGFDVKAWDPGANSGAGGYVDLCYNPSISTFFSGPGSSKSMLEAIVTFGAYTARVYDTWSTHYENVGLPGLALNQYPAGGFPGRSTNGFDDNNDGIVDDDLEKITSPPYPVPLRGIQVKIRVFEPDSRQIRELTVIQDFLPK